MLGITTPCLGACAGLSTVLGFQAVTTLELMRWIIEDAGIRVTEKRLYTDTFANQSTIQKTAFYAKFILGPTMLSAATGLAFRGILIYLGYTPWSMLAFAIIFGSPTALLTSAFSALIHHAAKNPSQCKNN